MRFRRTLLALLPLASLVAACGGDDDGPAIPFTEASVTQDGDEFTVRWAAEDAGDVTVYAGTDPDAVGRDREVGSGEETGEIVVDGLPDAPRWYFELVPDDGDPLVLADRSLHLAGAPNFRDVGGYRTEDGRWVRMGKVFRADALDELTDEELERVHALGIKLVCDLRTEPEREAHPDPDLGGEHEVFDVAADAGDVAQVITEAILTGDAEAQQELLGDGRGAQLMIDGGDSMVRSDSARTAYRAMFDRLASADHLPTVFHCSGGKDRTGWASAALLTALGVPEDVVFADYLLSNDMLRASNEATLGAVGGLIDPELVEPVIGVREEYLRSSFDAVADEHGDFAAYLADGIDVDDAQLAALEELLLVG